MDEKRLYRRWKRQYCRGLKAVAEQLDRCRKTGDAEAVHELRVAIRRTRLLALLGRTVIGRSRAMAYRSWAQSLADALSPVRDYDVMIDWARKVCHDPSFVRALQRDRAEAWREVRKPLHQEPPVDLAELRRVKAGAKKRGKLAARYEKIAGSTRARIEMEGAYFDGLDATGRHDLRRSVRRLKYLQELQKKPEQSERLAKLQVNLGELQNAQAMKQLLQNGRGRRGRASRLMRDIKREEAQRFTRCRRDIKRVVKSRS
jgi:CHAD domain-containing protein